MECKNCKQQLEQGVTVCPECGTDNTPAAAQGIMLTPGKLVAIVAGVVALTALVVALVMGGMGFSFNNEGWQDTIAAIERVSMDDVLGTAHRILTGPRAYAVVGKKAEKYLQYMK